MIIQPSHPFLSSSQDILDIVRPLQKLGIHYFSYTRVKKDGARIYLTTHPNVLEFYMANKFFLIGNTEGIPAQYTRQVIFWDSLPHQEIYDTAIRSQHIDHGIFIIEPSKDYCEFYGMATTQGNPSMINTYLSNMDSLFQFITFFKKQAERLIQNATSREIILPFRQKPLNFIEDRVDIFDKEGTVQLNLSPRQHDCVKQLLQGQSTKQIARHLCLSPRTIEDYLNQIKLKFQCKTKVELILKLRDL